MPHKFDPANRARLEAPERLALLPVEKVLALVEVRPGERVLDIGCGPGVFTVPLARAVAESGQVFGADLQPEMVEACERRVESLGLSNVAVGRSEENAIPLPPRSVDLVFACHLLHELEDPPAFLAEVRRVLRPAGRLVVIEWEKVETGIGPPVEHRLTPHESRALLEGNGFTVTGPCSVTWANYLLRARPMLAERGGTAVMAPAVLIYDGACPICQGGIIWVQRHAFPGQFEFLPCQSPERRTRFPWMAEEACLEALQLVFPDGRVLAGDTAIPEILRRLRGWRWLARLFGLPGVGVLAPRLYAWVARNRYAISCALARR